MRVQGTALERGIAAGGANWGVAVAGRGGGSPPSAAKQGPNQH